MILNLFIVFLLFNINEIDMKKIKKYVWIIKIKLNTYIFMKIYLSTQRDEIYGNNYNVLWQWLLCFTGVTSIDTVVITTVIVW